MPRKASVLVTADIAGTQVRRNTRALQRQVGRRTQDSSDSATCSEQFYGGACHGCIGKPI